MFPVVHLSLIEFGDSLMTDWDLVIKVQGHSDILSNP